MVLAACTVLVLTGCTSGTRPANGSSGLDLPSVGSSTTLTPHNVDGVSVALPSRWNSTPAAGTGLQLTDSGGGASVAVIVERVGAADGASSTASAYLESQLPGVLEKVMGITVTESLNGHAQTLDVAGADDAAGLEVTGARADEPVDCRAVAALAGPDTALLIGTDVEAPLWEQIVASLKVGTLQPG